MEQRHSSSRDFSRKCAAANTDADTNANTHSDTHSDADADTDTNANTHSDADTNSAAGNWLTSRNKRLDADRCVRSVC